MMEIVRFAVVRVCSISFVIILCCDTGRLGDNPHSMSSLISFHLFLFFFFSFSFSFSKHTQRRHCERLLRLPDSFRAHCGDPTSPTLSVTCDLSFVTVFVGSSETIIRVSSVTVAEQRI